MIQKSAIHQINCILKDNSIGGLEITIDNILWAWKIFKDLLKLQDNKGHTSQNCQLLPWTRSLMKESTPLLFRIKSIVKENHWNHLGFLISISGVRNLLRTQELFLPDNQSIFFNLDDTEKCYTSSCRYLKTSGNHKGWSCPKVILKGGILKIYIGKKCNIKSS